MLRRRSRQLAPGHVREAAARPLEERAVLEDHADAVALQGLARLLAPAVGGEGHAVDFGESARDALLQPFQVLADLRGWRHAPLRPRPGVCTARCPMSRRYCPPSNR